MSALRTLRVLVIALHLSLPTAVRGNTICQNFKFVVDKDVAYNHVLEGHVFKRLTVYSATQCHMMCRDDCLCVSMNYVPVSKENNCELNDASKEMEPAALKWKQGVDYYDLVRSYTVKGGGPYISRKHVCVNRCCNENPCVNGGLCREICDPHSTRFNCTCPDTHTGRRCDKKKHPRTCKDIAKNGASTSGKYLIFDFANEAFYVFCDMESESEFVWTLIQSFSLANEDTLNGRFGTNFPVNHGDSNNDVDWNSYRLSLPQMESLANHSTHLRATCNFPTEGLRYTDYARAKLEGHDIFGEWDNVCQLYEYINIRGNECSNCTALTQQSGGKAWTLKSYQSKQWGCDLDGRPGASGHENNFGRYRNGSINADHRCSSSPASTTQHWFGAKREL